MSIKDKKIFKFKGRVYFGDTDAAAVVYHAKYIHWLEASRIELLDDLDYPYSVFQEQKIGFIPTHIDINYHAPLRFSEYFEIHTQIESLKKVSFTLSSKILKGDQIMCTAKVRLACLNEKNWKLRQLPEEFLKKLTLNHAL